MFLKDYRRIGDPWTSLGCTPLDKVRVPLVFCRWKISLAGYESAEGSIMATTEAYPLVLDIKLHKQGTLPKEMVHVAGGKFKPDLDGLNQDSVAELELSDFLLDRYEVSNRQFKQFLKAGGYTKPEYWKHKFTQENRELAWEEAMKLFVDKTGRPGPATWELGDYPPGQVWGGIIPAVERRFKVAIMFAGGLRASMPPDHNQINFAPRITIPVLMQNGRYDSGFPLETSVKPLLALVGTPEKDKHLKIYESGHSVWKVNEYLKDEFDFLDQYLGPPK